MPWDHPRIRGDNFLPTSTEPVIKGSPPHTRGQRWLERWLYPTIRITPAYAGTTVLCLVIQKTQAGSPPHTRGQPVFRMFTSSRGWITPAYAGTTLPSSSIPIGFQDHPRIRGDNLFWHRGSQCRQGSPPHTRGQRLTVVQDVEEVGITPAYAGTTAYPLHYRRQSWDHPRIRGDNRERQKKKQPEKGSPPHTRGQRF